jgi:hypothetical protein
MRVIISKVLLTLGMLAFLVCTGYFLFLHYVVTQIAYQDHGFFAGIITFFMPFGSWIFWSVVLMENIGLWNPASMLFTYGIFFYVCGKVFILFSERLDSKY